MNQSDITWDVYESPIGPLTLIAGQAGLRGLWFPGKTPAPPEAMRAPLPEVTEQLDAYFAGELRAFEVDLDMRGPELDREVWRRLLDIPYGEDRELRRARRPRRPRPLRSPVSKRGSGRASSSTRTGATRWSIIVPCHRVIGADGSLTGYGSSLPPQAGIARAGGVGAARPGLGDAADQPALQLGR